MRLGMLLWLYLSVIAVWQKNTGAFEENANCLGMFYYDWMWWEVSLFKGVWLPFLSLHGYTYLKTDWQLWEVQAIWLVRYTEQTNLFLLHCLSLLTLAETERMTLKSWYTSVSLWTVATGQLNTASCNANQQRILELWLCLLIPLLGCPHVFVYWYVCACALGVRQSYM